METTTQYQIIRKLSDGAMAEILLATSPAQTAPVVLKVLRPELTTDPQTVGRFLDEVKLSRGFTHPNLLRALDAGRLPDGRLFWATEFLEGEDLAAWLRRQGPLDAARLVPLACALCDALDYVHQRGIVHRDLKPENVFLPGGLGNGPPRLIDFGLAWFAGRGTVRTGEGVILATPEYTPPECVNGGTATAWSDQYALGILLFEALTGAPPFVAANYGELMLKHLHEAPPPLPAACAHLTPVVHRLLAKDPADRFSSVAEVRHALESARPPEVVPPELLPAAQGEHFGAWEVVRLIGEGSMGRVYLARHTRLGRQAALKVLRPEHTRNAEVVKRLLQEAQSVNQINHEHIVEVYDFVEELEPYRVYCVMELLTGKSLSDLLAEKPLPVARAVSIVRQVCGALEAAHRVGVVHRDIKPDNVFVTRRSGISDYVKVLDFGVAKLMPGPGGVKSSGTADGAIIGTPAYMAPEQAASMPVDHRADVWAVGVLLYEMLAGRRPFLAEAFGQLAVEIITTRPPPLPRTTPAGEPIPAALRELVDRCLEKDAASRPQSMAELEAELANLSGRGVDLAVVGRRRLAIGLGVGLVLALLAGAGLWALRPVRPLALPPQALMNPPEPAPPAPAPSHDVGLDVQSTPAGARVVRTDTGEQLGVTPFVSRVPRGTGEIPLRVELAGHEPLARGFRPEADTALAFALVPTPVAPAAPPPPPVQAEPVPARRPKAPAKVDSPAPEPTPTTVPRDGVIDPFAN